MEVNGQPGSLATLTLGKDLLVTIEWEAGVPHNRSGCFGEKKNHSHLPEIKPWTVERVA
jgi:hypothetical protein